MERKRKRFTYSEDDMQKAILAVENGMSINGAAKSFKVPRMTLSDKVKGKTPIGRKMGPPSILSNEQEMLLERWILHLASLRFPIRKEQLLDSVQLLMKQLGKRDAFPNGRPGRHWYEAFLKRHPRITERSAQNLTARRAAVSEKNLRNWFAEVKTYIDENNLLNAFNDPRRIFNCDETAFFLSPKDNRVLAKKGQKTVHTVINSDEKECITTLLMGNAAGDIAPPMVVVNLKRIPQKLSQSVPDSWAIGRSDNGWMTGETFFEYFANVFYPWLVQTKTEFPVIVFCDGHSSHLTMALSEFCRKNAIDLIALYPNATQILQPMDVAVFHPLKVAWRKAVYAFRISNTGLPLKRDNFCPILNEALKNITPDILKNGFRRCGLCPFDANALDYAQLPRDQNLENATRPAGPSNPKILEHLIFFEDNIPSEKLAQFKYSGDAWTGPLEDTSLFDFWHKLKKIIADDKSTEASPEIDDHNKQDCSANPGVNNNDVNDFPIMNCNIENDFSILIVDPDIGTTSKDSLNENLGWLNNNMLYNDEKGDNVYEVTNTGELVKISVEGRDRTNELSPETIEVGGEKHNNHNDCSDSLKEFKDDTMSGRPLNTETNFYAVENAEEVVGDKECEMSSNLRHNDSSTLECNNTVTEELKKTPTHQSPSESMLLEPTIMKDFPSPFKKALFWPSTPTTDSNAKNRKSKEKVPAVATSLEWQTYFSKKEKEKADKLKKREENKRKREEIANKKKEIKICGKGKKKQCRGKENVAVESTDRWYCNICEEEFEQDMIQCLNCKCWVHEVCANVSKGAKKFYCSSCESAE